MLIIPSNVFYNIDKCVSDLRTTNLETIKKKVKTYLFNNAFT